MRALVLGSLLFAFPALAFTVDQARREINVKIVYVSTSAKGALDTVDAISKKTNADAKSEFTVVSTEDGEVKFFDFIPMGLGDVRGFKIRLHLYAASQPMKNAKERETFLKDLDGVVFIASVDVKRSAETVARFRRLQKDLALLGSNWRRVPMTIQIEDSERSIGTTPAAMTEMLELTGQPIIEASASTGVGVFDTLKSVTKQVLVELKRSSSPPAAHSP